MKAALAALIAVAACNQNSATSIVTPKHTLDFSDKKLEKTEASVEGIPFTIDVPKGLPRDARQGGDWETENPDFDYAPKVFTSVTDVSRIKSVADAKYFGTLDARAKRWLRSEQRPTGWAVTYAEEDQTRIEAITYTTVGEKLIKCKAVQAAHEGGKLPSYDKTLKMLESICDSVKPKSATP